MPDTAAPLPDRVLAWLNALRPAPQAVNARERLRVVLGAGLGLLLAGLLSHAAMAPGLPSATVESRATTSPLALGFTHS